MVRLQVCIAKREDVSLEDFQRNWKGEQAADIRRIMKAIGAQDVRQALTLNISRHDEIQERWGSGRPFEGTIEIHFDQPLLLEQTFDNPMIQETIQRFFDKHVKFIDVAKSTAFYSEAPVSLLETSDLARKPDLGAMRVDEGDDPEPDGG